MITRIINGVSAVLLLAFCWVQLNDPGISWIALYGGAMVWCAIAAIRPRMLVSAPARTMYALSLVIAGFLVIYYWPRESGWWRQEVWWNVEAVREGIGLMLAFVLMLGVLVTRRLTAQQVSISKSRHHESAH